MSGTGQGNVDRAKLLDLVGVTATIALAEAFGGTRLYVPQRCRPEHPISQAIGEDAAQALCRDCGPGTIRVPLARELRAARYRAEGCSTAKIAARLGLTESGVRGLFKRLDGHAARTPAPQGDQLEKRK